MQVQDEKRSLGRMKCEFQRGGDDQERTIQAERAHQLNNTSVQPAATAQATAHKALHGRLYTCLIGHILYYLCTCAGTNFMHLCVCVCEQAANYSIEE
jgi:hypothetical protein